MCVKRFICGCYFLLGVFAATWAAEDYRPEYLKLLKAEKFDKLDAYLSDWEKKEPKDPELYIARFNYYVNRKKHNGTGVITHAGETFMAARTLYDPADIRTGLSYLDKGLKIAPGRIDMHWGKIAILLENDNYAGVKNEICTVLDKTKANNGKWILSGDTPVSGGEDYIFDYLIQFYGGYLEHSDEECLGYLKTCAEKQVKLFPKNIYGHNFLGLAYLYSDKPKDALRAFSAAEKLDDNDCIIKLNIARAYAQLKDAVNTERYCNIVIKNGDNRQGQAARQILDSVKDI